ncbi:hypothetical protein [Ralstonia solanacearum]|uniref:hypothetical protein n=1 Tax=Ralstonia solanacearum TaxID=305 RepID=UPI00138ADF25|nr:hypothetical protein [Ralstonia solanacearum]
MRTLQTNPLFCTLRHVADALPIVAAFDLGMQSKNQHQEDMVRAWSGSDLPAPTEHAVCKSQPATGKKASQNWVRFGALRKSSVLSREMSRHRNAWRLPRETYSARSCRHSAKSMATPSFRAMPDQAYPFLRKPLGR